MQRSLRVPALLFTLVWVGLGLGCKPKTQLGPITSMPTTLAGTQTLVQLEPAPDHLRGRVAVPAGARIYARPNYAAANWEVELSALPLEANLGPPRTRAMRVVGLVRAPASDLGGAGDFLAVTNDLEGEDEDAPDGCGDAVAGLEHLRILLYVAESHLIPVLTRPLELVPFSPEHAIEQLWVGAGARLSEPLPIAGLPPLDAGLSWRSVDADGIRVVVQVPEDAIGVAWDPGQTAEIPTDGQLMFRDAEGSMMVLHDDGGSSVDLSVRNSCGEHRRTVTDREEIEGLRGLGLDAFYDQSPPPDPQARVEIDADATLAQGTPLRWTDGDLAGEVLEAWSVAASLGQTWNDKRCFPLPLGLELVAQDNTALVCVSPEALTFLDPDLSFATSDMLEVGGSVQLGPVQVLSESAGAWDPDHLRHMLNNHHESVADCLRPLLSGDQEVIAASWDLDLSVTQLGIVDEVVINAKGPSHDGVEDCLRAEVFTWLLPEGLGELRVPVELGDWDIVEAASGDLVAPPEEEEETALPRERGKVVIIRDEEPSSD